MISGTSRTRWRRGETSVIVHAIRSAPMLCPKQPWTFQFMGRDVEFYESAWEIDNDPTFLDQRLSCGIALANAMLAVRELGWEAKLEVEEDYQTPDRIAGIITSRPRKPTNQDSMLYEQIHHPEVIKHGNNAKLRQLINTVYIPGTRLELISDRSRAAALASILMDTSRRLDGDRRCADELAPWLLPSRVHSAVVTAGSVPITNLEPYQDAICAIAARFSAHPMVAVLTEGNQRSDQICAGAALQIACLTGTRLGFTTHPITCPTHLPEMQSRLMNDLKLTWVPQVLLGLESAMTP